MKYLARVAVKHHGGRLTAGDSTLEVRGADSAAIYVSAGTSFRGAPFTEQTAALLKAAMRRSYAAEKASHIRAYRKLFNRASVYLDNQDTAQAALPTDKRLAAYAADPSDNGLPVLYFQYGRYLLISSTRPGSLPE
jgi:alpha-L-fucosidase 2